MKETGGPPAGLAGVTVPPQARGIKPATPAAVLKARARSAWARVAPHVTGIGLLAALTIWIMRRFVFTGGIPAGTDMLGFASRAAQNASPGRLADAWSPASFGARRVFSFDNILGAVTMATRDPVVTVKLLDVLTLFGSGLAAYALMWCWYRRRVASAAAGLLYLASQASLTRWGSGQLNVEIIICLAPVLLLAWSSCLERFTLSRATGFAFTLGGGLLVRADLVLYVVPFLLLYAAVTLTIRNRARAGLSNMARTLAVAVPGVLLLNAAWLIPSLTGYRPQYETLSQIFDTSMLYTRSLDLYPSLLGFGREIGYFGFSGTQTWYSYPGLPLWGYYAFATVIPLLAYSALWWHRDRRTVFLVLASVLATLGAPGIRAPVGPLYLWVAGNVPVVGNLRDPNRWLIVQAVAYAVLAALAIEHISAAAVSRLRARTWRPASARRWGRAAPGVLTIALAVAGLVPVLPTLAIGLRTWHVTRPQQELLSQVRGAPGSGVVASIPFDQDYRYLVQGTYRGYEHDLGYESALFTGRPDIGDGSWDQRSANFAAYEATLLSRADPAFTGMLASAGVNRAISFNYPLIAPQLLSRTAGPRSQQRTVSRLPGLTPLLVNPAGTDYAVNGAAPPLSLRRNIAVVLGGSQGIAALARRPGFKPADWAVFTAGDVIATRGYPGLLALIRQADLVLLADERPADLAVQGTKPLTKLAGITNDPQVGRLATDVPTDQSAQTGSLSDPASPIAQPSSLHSDSMFTVRSSQRVQIWARVLATPRAATIEARIGRVRVGSVTPVTLGTGGFEWLRVATARVAAGAHRVTLSAVPSRFGDTYEVEEAAVLDPGALRVAGEDLSRVLTERGDRVAYSFNLADVAKWAWPSLTPRLGPAMAPSFSMHGWTVPAGTGTAVTAAAAPGGATAPQFTARPGRSVYTVAKIRYRRPQDWANRPYIYLEFRGTGSGKLYSITFGFGPGGSSDARYVIADNTRGWRTLAFPTADPGPGSGRADWSRVQSARIALASKSEPGTFAVGVPRPSKSVESLTIPLPVLSAVPRFGAAARKPTCLGAASPRTRWLPTRNSLMLPVSGLRASCDIYAGSREGYRQLPATPVRLHRTGTQSWSYSYSARGPGVLVWTQAYDPLWVLRGAGVKGAPIPVLSLLNGYLADSGSHSGTIAFAGESRAVAGLAVTIVTSLLLLSIAVVSRRWGWLARFSRRAGEGTRQPRRWPPPAPLRPMPGICLTAGSVFLVLCPAASLAGLAGLLLPLSCAALVAFGASAMLIAVGRAGSASRDPAPTRPGEERPSVASRAHRER